MGDVGSTLEALRLSSIAKFDRMIAAANSLRMAELAKEWIEPEVLVAELRDVAIALREALKSAPEDRSGRRKASYPGVGTFYLDTSGSPSRPQSGRWKLLCSWGDCIAAGRDSDLAAGSVDLPLGEFGEATSRIGLANVLPYGHYRMDRDRATIAFGRDPGPGRRDGARVIFVRSLYEFGVDLDFIEHYSKVLDEIRVLPSDPG